MAASTTSQPPRIERLHVKGYRTLRDIELSDLTPLTVLIGPNGSGKSTVFDVLAFLAECFRSGVRSAVEARGDGSLRPLRSLGASEPIVIELDYRESQQQRVSTPKVTYHLELDEQQGSPIVAREWMRWSRKGKGRPFTFLDVERGKGEVVSGELPEEHDERKPVELASAETLAVSTLGALAGNPRVRALLEFIKGWHISRLAADRLCSSVHVGPRPHLSATGDNLVNVISYLEQGHPQVLERIFEALRRRVPRIEKVLAERQPGGQMLLQIKDAPFLDSIQARYVSDGTMKLLAYLVQLYDPDPPPLIGIEEPENFLHPRILPRLAEECATASASTQMLVTTHSPFFIDDLEPAQVWAMHRDLDGYAQATRLADMSGVREQLAAGAKLGQLWMENYLDEANP